jgi:hypothetical protein
VKWGGPKKTQMDRYLPTKASPPVWQARDRLLAADPDVVLRVAGGIVRIAAGIVRAAARLHREDLDEDISIAGFLAGRRDQTVKSPAGAPAKRRKGA